MEIMIILIAIAMIGYVIHQSLPSTQYKKGKKYYDSGNIPASGKIFTSIFKTHPEAPAYLAECKLKQGLELTKTDESSALKLFNKIIEVKNNLPSGANKKHYEVVESKAYYEIAHINYKKATNGNNSKKIIDQLKDNLSLIDSATKTEKENEFETLKSQHLSDLAEIYFAFGVQNEKADKLVEATHHYASARNYALARDFGKKISNSKALYSSITRMGICCLKRGEKVDESLLADVNKAPDEYKNDFYYRYTVQLLKRNELTKAEKMVVDNLNYSSKTVEMIKKYINSKKIKSVIKIINKINYSLDQLYEKSFPIADVQNLYETIDQSKEEIRSINSEAASKIQQIKKSLFNRLLAYYISEKQYANGINLIQKYLNYWDKPELLKDIAICCYGFTAQGNITEKNYRTIISNWLTAIYSDTVILKSLEETTWDDEYTFTLVDSINSNKYSRRTDLPVNVNYHDVSNTNISIGTTQRELLQRYETLLFEKVKESTLAETVNDFYNKEKTTIDKIVSILDCDILLASPYFAITNGNYKIIIDKLNNLFNIYSNEEILKAGIPYLNNISEGSVGEYATANELVKKIVIAIQNEDLTKVKSIVASNNRNLIDKYSTICEFAEESLFNVISNKINEEYENEDLIHLMNECLHFTKQNDKLKYQYSNYVANFCIAKVNSDEMNNYRALCLMKNAYLYLNEDPRICKNIVTLIRYNLLDYFHDKCENVQEMFSILDLLKQNRSRTLMNNNDELHKELEIIDNSLHENGSSISIVLSTHYSQLSIKGQKLFKIIRYMEQFL